MTEVAGMHSERRSAARRARPAAIVGLVLGLISVALHFGDLPREGVAFFVGRVFGSVVLIPLLFFAVAWIVIKIIDAVRR